MARWNPLQHLPAIPRLNSHVTLVLCQRLAQHALHVFVRRHEHDEHAVRYQHAPEIRVPAQER
ncbi:hypothetical protein N0V95_008326 [Ascochyta clinopodiicola]|nr:hypothetical protein N0V95_008326 [Ascochyta clinopodiicola]